MADKSINRRAALKKLGFGVVAAYVVPEFLVISTAAAGTQPSDVSAASTPESSPSPASQPSTVSEPSAPEPSLPSGAPETDWREDDTCNVHASRSNQVTIKNSDFRRAQRAVARGEAMPLSDVFQSVHGQVQGNLVEVRFSNAGQPPIYQFRMVSNSGKLITVFTDASSAEILRIVSC